MARRALAIFILGAAVPSAFAQQVPCDPGAFREVVSSASASITVMHETKSKLFQEKLQNLRALHNWPEAEYIAKATPLVKDATTTDLDSANQTLLAKVQSLEASNANSEAGRCAMLGEVKLTMEKIVANTAAKWEHMMSNVERASTALQAGLSH
ncbi:MAG: hypothetical protein HY765_07850 [Rhodomicrobium sp.]|nr:hypothetical protein [Rhodomicrobium sp.]